ncbi:hypothetical protein ID866_7879 [Astraeus odoratus]|nr:hypothetical protein ID866_7879 [Astraeus odoratus]
MLQLVKSRSHIIFSDVDLNSSYTVYLNIYRHFLLTAAKMHYYIESWGIDLSKSENFIRNAIHQIIRYSYATIQRKSSSKVAKASGGRCNVQKTHVDWSVMAT